MSVKDIIREAIRRVRKGKGSDSDKAIHMLLEQNKRLKQKIEDLETNRGKEEAPLHQQKPWYMR
jgi:hypothetical protein